MKTWQRIKWAWRAAKAVWRAEFPAMGQTGGSHIVRLPNGQAALSLAEACRRGAWVYADEPKVSGCRVWNPETRKAE